MAINHKSLPTLSFSLHFVSFFRSPYKVIVTIFFTAAHCVYDSADESANLKFYSLFNFNLAWSSKKTT